MAWPDRLYRWSCGLNRVGVGVVLMMLVAVTLLVLTEVLLRNVFSASTHVMNEFVGYSVAAMTFLALGYGFEQGVLIRMGLLLAPLGRFPAARRGLEILLTAAAIVTMAVVFRYFLLSAMRNFKRGYVSETPAQVPLWIPESFLLAGLAILLIHLAAYFLLLVFTRNAPIRDV